MRQKAGASIRIFNETEGEWSAQLQSLGKKEWGVLPQTLLRPPAPSSPLCLWVAPIKRQEILIEKVTELGVGEIFPVLTDHTVVRHVNEEKWASWATEAAEQSERLSVPVIHKAQPLTRLLSNWSLHKPVLWAAERRPTPQEGLFPSALPPLAFQHPTVLVGPEGGFSEAEKKLLSSLDFIYPWSLGEGILRAETAALVAVAFLAARLQERVISHP
jgi:16S rRNA (uracil1498-N3)-methyltransferase